LVSLSHSLSLTLSLSLSLSQSLSLTLSLTPTGESTDYVSDRCIGILASLDGTNDKFHRLFFSTDSVAQVKLFKTCLGDSDGVSSDNVEVYNWDYGTQLSADGSFLNPHLIKLIDATQDQDESGASLLIPGFYEDPSMRPFPKTRLCNDPTVASCSNKDPAGFFAVLFFDGYDFQIFNRAGADYAKETLFHVYTTTGHLQLVNAQSVGVTLNSQLTTTASVARSYYSKEFYVTEKTDHTAGSDFVGQVMGLFTLALTLIITLTLT
jgi:hypothetical protein